MSEQIDINVGLINEEITITAYNDQQEVIVNAVSNIENIDVTANTSLIEININTAPISIINPQDYDLSQFTNSSPNPFVQVSGLSSYVPSNRIITINGISQDLTTNRSWSVSANWGSIGGSLSSQTDLVAALAAKQDTLTLTTTGSSGAATLTGATLNIPNYTISGLGGVPSSRTLTINGTTYDLSADRTWTIATGLTVGTTPISSGTVGRILFEGAGNVLQESANLNFDTTTNNFIIGTTATSSPKLLITSSDRSDILLRSGAATNDTLSIYAFGGTYGSNYAQIGVNDGVNAANQGGAIYLDSRTGTAPPIRLTVKGTGTTAMTNAMSVFNTGNVAINTIIDSGYKLDVNGTIRSSGIIYAGPFTPGAGLQATDYIATTGRIRAAGGISFRSPIVGDNTFNGFAPGGNGILVYLSNGTPITFGGYGADVNPIIQTSADFNPSSGTSNKSSISIVGVYQTSGSYSGGIRGLYYDPSLISMTGVAFHRAIETTSGNIVFNGGNVLIGTTTDVASSLVTMESTTKGFLPPRMTTTEKNAITSPATGLVVFDTTLGLLSSFNGSSWLSPSTVTPAALTKTDDTNVTLTLGGSPSNALLQGVSLTLGWTGTLADSRIASASVWNAKQDAIILTTTGSSGSSTLIGSTLNIPTYTLAGLGGQPLATNLTSLSGLTYASTSFVKMTASGTFALDTNIYLTSAITSLGGLTGATQTFGNDTNVTIVSSGTTHTITWSGTLADSRIASAATWNAKQDAITLTTTGTSGPATLVGSTLNIPQYSGGGGGSTPVKLTSQTLTAASWTLSGGYYTYAFSNVNIDTTCDVSVTPQNASYLTAYNAQVLPFINVAAGVATFYSQFPPQADMVVDIVITQTT